MTLTYFNIFSRKTNCKGLYLNSAQIKSLSIKRNQKINRNDNEIVAEYFIEYQITLDFKAKHY